MTCHVGLCFNNSKIGPMVKIWLSDLSVWYEWLVNGQRSYFTHQPEDG